MKYHIIFNGTLRECHDLRNALKNEGFTFQVGKDRFGKISTLTGRDTGQHYFEAHHVRAVKHIHLARFYRFRTIILSEKNGKMTLTLPRWIRWLKYLKKWTPLY